jgi:hypothetical protein
VAARDRLELIYFHEHRLPLRRRRRRRGHWRERKKVQIRRSSEED